MITLWSHLCPDSISKTIKNVAMLSKVTLNKPMTAGKMKWTMRSR